MATTKILNPAADLSFDPDLILLCRKLTQPSDRSTGTDRVRRSRRRLSASRNTMVKYRDSEVTKPQPSAEVIEAPKRLQLDEEPKADVAH